MRNVMDSIKKYYNIWLRPEPIQPRVQNSKSKFTLTVHEKGEKHIQVSDQN